MGTERVGQEREVLLLRYLGREEQFRNELVRAYTSTCIPVAGEQGRELAWTLPPGRWWRPLSPPLDLLGLTCSILPWSQPAGQEQAGRRSRSRDLQSSVVTIWGMIKHLPGSCLERRPHLTGWSWLGSFCCCWWWSGCCCCCWWPG